MACVYLGSARVPTRIDDSVPASAWTARAGAVGAARSTLTRCMIGRELAFLLPAHGPPWNTPGSILCPASKWSTCRRRTDSPTRRSPERTGTTTPDVFPRRCTADRTGAGAGARASLVANPGCYPTAAAAAIVPLLPRRARQAGVDHRERRKRRGRRGTQSPPSTSQPTRQNFSTYSVGVHRHQPEIRAERAAVGACRRFRRRQATAIPIRCSCRTPFGRFRGTRRRSRRKPGG